jgi:hypothetical protein
MIAQLLADLRAVGDVSGETICRKAENDVDAAPFHAPQQLLDAWPALVACATDGAVVKSVDEVPAMLIDHRLTAFDLCLDGLLVLAIGRVARVDNDVFAHEAP